jgi:cytochrome c
MTMQVTMMQVLRALATAGALLCPLCPITATAQDAGHGKALFAQCIACHSLEAGHNEAGPHLHGLFGRKAASVDDFVYSPPMRRANFTWTPDLLDDFLREPQSGPFRGNRMPFAGMSDAKARADLIAYLKEATR